MSVCTSTDVDVLNLLCNIGSRERWAGNFPFYSGSTKNKAHPHPPLFFIQHECTSCCFIRTTPPSLAHLLVLSALLLALDEADDSLHDIHWDARDLIHIRPHIIALQQRLQFQIHRLHFRIIFQITNQTLP